MGFWKKFLGKESAKSIQNKFLSASEADRMLRRTKELANIANKTTDRDVFYRSINEIKSILRELAKHEGKLPFIGSPSADLRNLEQMEQKQIELLEKRIEETKKEQEKDYSHHERTSYDYGNPAIFNLKEIEKPEDIQKSDYEQNEESDYPYTEEKIYSNKINHDLLHNSNLDQYFIEAGRFIIDKDKASIGMIQRIFKIGFNRAARIIDQLAEAGVIGEEEGTKPRKVLMTADMFEQYIEDMSHQSEKEEETDEISIDVEWFLKDRLNIDVDYSKDGEMLKNMKNIIIPSVSNDIQIESINTLLKYNSPMTMKLILIDDSIITYSGYNGVPQLLIPVITKAKKIDGAIDWCFAEMQERINKFVEHGVKNIDSYNEKAKSLEENTLPKIIVIANESSEFFAKVSSPLERMFMNCNMVGMYFILFSRFSLKSLSLGMVGELLEVYTSEKLRMLLLNSERKSEVQQITRNFDDMDGHQFEYFCAKLLKNNGFTNVEVTQGSGDQGIDILATKDGIKYGIQCKCYSSDIGNKAVQEVFSGKTFYNCHVGVVLTNRYFTSSAKELAEKSGVLLWDRDRLNEMIKNIG